MDDQAKLEFRVDLARYSDATPLFSDDCVDPPYRQVVLQHELKASGLLAYFNSRLPEKAQSVRNVTFAFIDETEFNAMVFPRVSGGFWIAMNIGVLSLLSSSFAQLWRHRSFLSHIGNAAEEQDDGFVSLFSQVAASHLATSRSTAFLRPGGALEAGLIRGPACRTRQAAVNICHSLAFDSIILHEYGHLLSRHIDLLSKSGRQLRLIERPFHLGDSKATETQSWELEADICSSLLLLERVHQHPEWPYLESSFEVDLLLDLWVIVQTMIMWMFLGKFSRDLADTREASHPHPLVRINALITYLLSANLPTAAAILQPDRVRIASEHLRAFLFCYEETVVGTRFEISPRDRLVEVSQASEALVKALFHLAEERSAQGLDWYLRIQG